MTFVGDAVPVCVGQVVRDHHGEAGLMRIDAFFDKPPDIALHLLERLHVLVLERFRGSCRTRRRIFRREHPGRDVDALGLIERIEIHSAVCKGLRRLPAVGYCNRPRVATNEMS